MMSNEALREISTLSPCIRNQKLLITNEKLKFVSYKKIVVTFIMIVKGYLKNSLLMQTPNS